MTWSVFGVTKDDEFRRIFWGKNATYETLSMVINRHFWELFWLHVSSTAKIYLDQWYLDYANEGSSLLQNVGRFINKQGVISQLISVILTKMYLFKLQII